MAGSEDTLHLVAPADTLGLETADSIASSEEWGIVLTAPAEPETVQGPEPTEGMSWSVVMLLVPALIVALKIRTSPKFLGSLVRELVSVRERGGLFDTTVRESSLMFFLCLQAVVSGGVLLGVASPAGTWPAPEWLGWIPAGALHTLLCISVAAIYMVFMWVSYNIVGRVFEDEVHTRIWIRGFEASMALSGIVWLPCALVALANPDCGEVMAWIGAVVFMIAKLAFVCKGFRIFFSAASSWVLFLYYLCSLEGVPVYWVLSQSL